MKKLAVSLLGVFIFTAIFIVFAAFPSMSSEHESRASSTGSYEWSQHNIPFQGIGQPGESNLHDIASLDANHIWAVGEQISTRRGYIFFYDGSSWSIQYEQDQALWGVCALDATHVWAVGRAGTIVFYDGANWTPQNSGYSGDLLGVDACDASHIWAVGAQDPMPGPILFSDGHSWSQQGIAPNWLFDVSALDPNHVWAAGDWSTIVFYDGSSWSTQLSGGGDCLRGISALDTEHVWAVGGAPSRDAVYFYDGSSWSGQSIGANEWLWGVDVYSANQVWAVGEHTGSLPAGAIFLYDGSTWSFQNSGVTAYFTCVSVINEYKVVVGGYMGHVVFGEKPQPPPNPPPGYDHLSYFAEGYTGQGFHEYLCLGNPTTDAAGVQVVYLFSDGKWKEETYTLPPQSRFTINVNTAVGADKEVSARIASDKAIVAERPMYFNYQGRWTGGSDAVGATTPSTTWYFAEGYTGSGFDEWICVLNPGEAQANLTFYFQTQEEGENKIEGLSVAPHSRGSFRANDLLGGKSYQTSLELTSDQPIVAERPMYFDYTGRGNWHWEGGHCTMGATSLAKSYYFAEGTTRSGFEEWLTLQNPNQADITVHATYQKGPGQGDPVEKDYPVGAGRRYTVPVNKEIGADKDVSVYLSSSSPFLAERPMYFKYSYKDLTATGGHCVIGAPSPSSEWFLAEGYTGSGFNQWLCLQNPGDTDSTVEITYYTQEKGALDPKQVSVPAHSRNTLMVNEHAGAGYQLSTRVKVLSGPPVVVERPMYFIYNGWDGGHDVVGYTP
jgi:hypothetical protein